MGGRCGRAHTAGLGESGPGVKLHGEAHEVNSEPGSLVSFLKGRYRVDGYVDSQNLLEKVDTWTPNPILGDMLIELPTPTIGISAASNSPQRSRNPREAIRSWKSP